MVYLTGAGTGKMEYLTIQAQAVIRRADVLIYDNLINLSILSLTKQSCELIYVGKREGKHTLSQESINALLATKGKEYDCVVRLKGGDPYIFGRGAEEGKYLLDHGVSFEIISGISSCFAVPAAAGIPVTHRDCASSFHVITGHKKKDGGTLDFEAIAKLSGTLVFLMGVSQMKYLAENLIRHGMSPKTPCAVIQNGTTQKQKEVFSTLCRITEDMKVYKITSPAVIVVGDVCAYHTMLNRDEVYHKPLSKITIALTGTASFCKSICRLIQKEGGDYLDLGLITTKPISFGAFSKLDFSAYTWIVFSSVNGIKAFLLHWKTLKRDIRSLSHIKFAVIGEKTAQALYDELGIIAQCMPEHFYNKDLGYELISKLTEKDRVLLMRAKESSQILPDILTEHQIDYTDFPIYETVEDERKKDALRLMEADYIVFASASAVRAYDRLREPSMQVPKIVSIGDVTTHALEALGYQVYKTAKKATAEGIIDCIRRSV